MILWGCVAQNYGFLQQVRHLWKEQPDSSAKVVFYSVNCRLGRWKEHIMKITNVFSPGDEALQKVNVTGLLISLVAAGVLLVIIALIIFYCCKNRCKSRQPPG